jgi:hypothetical protein
MDRFSGLNGLPITSLRAINDLPIDRRDRIYSVLLHPDLLARYSINPISFRGPTDDRLVEIDAPLNTGSVEVKVWHAPEAPDPVLYFQLADTPNNQIIVLLFVINDPESPRFDIDRNWQGERTKFGTMSRNINAEIEAMKAGLGPGQIRRGLHLSRKMQAAFEEFVSRLGHELFFFEPLAYHTAILFERYGCNYSVGKKKMEWIDHEFQAPQGELYKRLDGSNPFRMPGAEKSVRGRSWAIHDGILGEPFTGIHMYRRIGVDAGINTFPKAEW